MELHTLGLRRFALFKQACKDSVRATERINLDALFDRVGVIVRHFCAVNKQRTPFEFNAMPAHADNEVRQVFAFIVVIQGLGSVAAGQTTVAMLMQVARQVDERAHVVPACIGNAHLRNTLVEDKSPNPHWQ
jgi:hypothetical protein